jgi:protein-disulfide isomerase
MKERIIMDFNQFQKSQNEFKNNGYGNSDKLSYYDNPNIIRSRKNNFRFWLGWVILVVVLALGLSFGVALFQEVNSRNREIAKIKNNLEINKGSSFIDESLIEQLQDQLKEQNSDVNNSSETSTIDLNGVLNSALSRERQLAEKRDRPTFGNPEADLVIVGFIDFECPFCQDAFPALRTMTNRYKDEIFFIFRNYPLLGEQSSMLAQAAMCAHEQGKFWNFHDRYFPAQGQIQTSETLQSLLMASGIDINAFSVCISQQKYRNLVQEDIYNALDLGVAGTPTFFVNGYKLPGAVTLEAWEQIISKHRELKKNN